MQKTLLMTFFEIKYSRKYMSMQRKSQFMRDNELANTIGLIILSKKLQQYIYGIALLSSNRHASVSLCTEPKQKQVTLSLFYYYFKLVFKISFLQKRVKLSILLNRLK